MRAPRRAHLEILARNGDADADAELYHGPRLPPLAAHVWGWWADIAQTRGGSGFGPNPLTRVEVRAWEADEGVALDPWERRAIYRLDAAWRLSQQPDPNEET